MTTIDDSNYERWLVRYADGLLLPDEKKAVEQWLANHPAKAEELVLYIAAPRLEAEDGVRYEGDVPGSRRRLWPVLLRWSAAAAIVVAILLPVGLRHNVGEPDGVQVAAVKKMPVNGVQNKAMVMEMEKVRPAIAQMREPVAMTVQHTVEREISALVDDNYVGPQESLLAEQANAMIACPSPLEAIYVDDLIVFDTVFAMDDGEEGQMIAIVQVQEERTYGGISVPRIVGSIIKSNIKK